MRLSTLRSVALAAAAFVLLASDASAQTIAAARTAGVGSTVTVTGVVSRAKGAFTQMQDATAGISVRQTTGGIFDAVASGQIAPGTTLTVTGVTSQFRGLYQINGADITSFTIGAQVAAPAPQTITVAQLSADGEQYESELVQIEGATIAGTGIFTAATNYDLTQASGVGVMRIVNATDTDVDDTNIPAGLATIIGVVGQFDTATPATAGYQIQPILASDVAPFNTSSEPVSTAGALSMRVANPVRGAAQVRVSAVTEARLAVYDVLGRQVSALSVAGDTATLPSLAPGVYVLRLTAGADVLTRTVTVVR